ncbi:MAG: class I SAM-dependent methyltransferase [Alphaproteobacteria bacterium]
MLTQLTYDKLFSRLEGMECGNLTISTPDGKTRSFTGKQKGENARIDIHDWSVLPNMVRKGDIGFAEDYRAGKWDTDNLPALTILGLENRKAMDNLVTGSKLSRTISMLSYLLRVNSLKGSKKNIHAHYDIGNEFYKLWLDPTMTYSAAIYKNGDEDLVNAQHNKYDRIVDCLGNNSGNLLEVGCGWGGFAERANQKGDFDIKGITLSEEQHEYASQRLGRDAKIALEDYRHQEGRYNNIVSIEMFEAVGERYWPVYFQKLGGLLNNKGKAVIQTITMNEADFPRYRKGGDFIRSYIFPGGMLPSPSKFKEQADKAGLRSGNEFFFGQDYAKTLEVWLENFENNHDKIKAMGFDDGFIRLWRFYLAGCIAGFRTGRTDVMQVELSHA